MILGIITRRTKLYGVLQPRTMYIDTTMAAGVRMRSLEIGWDLYEPTQGNFSASYIASEKAKLAAMRAAGASVVLDLGLQYPPTWATAIRPMVDQAGHMVTVANTFWSSAVRAAVASYIARVFADLGTSFAAVRLGSGAQVETLYPDALVGMKSYWAFDTDAQAMCPVPGWKPGDASPNNEAATFWDWYVGRLINTMNYLQGRIRRAYSGPIQQLMPGQGVRPEQVPQLIASNLTDPTAYSSERAAVWDTVIAGIARRKNIVVYCSSLADSSAFFAVNEQSTDRRYWSAAHWIASNADRYGMAKAGENPGQSSYVIMRKMFEQAASYGYNPLLWAFEEQLYGGVYATLAEYAALIRQAS